MQTLSTGLLRINLENTELRSMRYTIAFLSLPEKQAQVFKMKTILGYETET
jgi:hypothetical protein